MKAVNYRQNEEHYSQDGKTVCWLIYRGVYRLQTTDPEVVRALKNYKNGIREIAWGLNFYMRQYGVSYKVIDRVLRLAKLPPRRKSEKLVRAGKERVLVCK